MTTARNGFSILRLPDELLQGIVFTLPPRETLAFGLACKRTHKISYEPLVWRRHCVLTWIHWESHHEFGEKLLLPPAQTSWRRLYNDRRQVDREALELFEQMLSTQHHRFQRMEDIAKHGYDVKDLMRSLMEETPDDAEDVLARRFYATTIMGHIHRATALSKWARLQNRQMVKMEEVLGAFDLFVLSGQRGDLDDLSLEFDRLALSVRDETPDFGSLSIRRQAVRVVEHLRSNDLLGNPNEEDYHALRNNFLSIALFDEPHTSLPLQSVAIYCAVARRLGINAKPSNYPGHVHAVIEAPPHVTLDGRQRVSQPGAEPELMHLDPWRSSEEVPTAQLQLRLTQMGVPPEHQIFHLGPASTAEMVTRTARNVMTSVREARQQQQRHPPLLALARPRRDHYPNVEAAWYATVWSLMVLGDGNAALSAHRRRECLPYLVESFQAHYPEDLGLLESIVAPLFAGEREHHVLMHLISTARATDRTRKAPRPRTGADAAATAAAATVRYHIGHHFRHARYGYVGVIVGWDPQCGAEQRWIEQMRVDELPRGREQPFYYILDDDQSIRYVAEENIRLLEELPSEALMQRAGRYFKRWDPEKTKFVSNIQDEYPDD